MGSVILLYYIILYHYPGGCGILIGKLSHYWCFSAQKKTVSIARFDEQFWGIGLWKEDILGQIRDDGESISAYNMCLWI
jgi:hypothetical protein